MTSMTRLATITALASAIALPSVAQAEDKETIRIGWGPWATNEAITKVVQPIIEERFGHDVELVQGGIAPIYAGVANGDFDFFLGSWQPDTQAKYVEKFEKDFISLGTLYNGGKLGWAVPEYVPEDKVSSIEDLKKEGIAEKFDNRVQGIGPGGGLMQKSEKAVNHVYNLADDYTLATASGPAMTAALKRAVTRDEWIIVTAWSPHWKFAAYDLRYLEDPENVFGTEERILAIGREGFFKDHPRIASFIDRVYMPTRQMEQMMLEAEETDVEKAAEKYIENHPERIDYWVTGEHGGEI